MQRFVTIDVFRGLSIFLMIIVNTPGAGAEPYTPLRHANWHGYTLTDMVFPAFLFAAGTAMPFAMRRWNQVPEFQVTLKILKRSFLIFLVGLLLTWYTTMFWNIDGNLSFASISDLRIMAVLQRIALCYLLAALIARMFSDKTILKLCIGILLAYWIVLLTFGDAGEQYTITGNAVRKLDLLVLGEKHMYTVRGISFDPEGLLSTLPATVNVLAGYLTGKFLLSNIKAIDIPAHLLIIGNGLLAAALIWDLSFPINKQLWTSSYVVFTCGVSVISLAIIYYFVELRDWSKGVYFFLVFGRNPLFLYVLSNLLLFILILPVGGSTFHLWLNQITFQRIAPGALGSLLFAMMFTMGCWFVGWVMDKKKVYIKL